MKRILFLAFWCCQLIVTLQAAPPLRGLMPMKLADGTIIKPLAETISPFYGDAPCASQAVIGNGNYLQHSGSPRILTILAAFQDYGFVVNNPVQAFDQYLNGDKQEDLGNHNQLNVASVRQYFETCSQGQFSPQFDVVGPVTLPQKLKYYGGSNASGSDDKFTDFCKDAMEQARDLVNDWSLYDNDKDGNIELVCVIFAGFGQNQGGADSTIWAKASVKNLTVNNQLRITRFNCCSELFHPQLPNYINGTGVFIHEFSHCMGLPDLYATTSAARVNNQGMETYSIMDYGLYNYNSFAPCPYNAWEQETMGWKEMEDARSLMTDGVCQIDELLPLIEGGKAYKLENSDNDRDFIVMENIQQRGLNYKSYGHGLLVYHVDYPYSSVNMTDSPNNNPGHPSVAVVPSGGLLINSYLRGNGKQYTNDEWKESLAASPFPGTQEVTSLTAEMQLPNYCFYNGNTVLPTGFILSNITEDTETGSVSFIVSPDEPEIQKCATPTINIAGGVVSFECETEDVTFKWKYAINGSNAESDGDKAILGGTTNCHITVYATKEGYQDSDIAEMDVELHVGKKGDVNTDGAVDVGDIVTVANIMAGYDK